jgi:hypothetical protein
MKFILLINFTTFVIHLYSDFSNFTSKETDKELFRWGGNRYNKYANGTGHSLLQHLNGLEYIIQNKDSIKPGVDTK